MKLRRWLVFLVGALAPFFAAAAPAPLLNDARQGEALARELRTMQPTENAAFRGTLTIDRPDAEELDVTLTTEVTVNDGWRTVYAANTGTAIERLTIVRRAEGGNLYTYATNGGAPRIIPAEQATNSFAGSDFALLDLGTEFFNWPGQVLLKREMRKGRGCHVLESRPAKGTFYSRVVSWIDEETNGLLLAEAYDLRGKLLKQFEVRGFKKVAGRWQVKEMELRNRQTKSSTRLQFHFDEN